MNYLLAFCDKSYIVEILLIVKTFFKMACYIVPPIIIIISIVHFTKGIISGKEEDMKEGGQLLVKRLIAGLVIMMLPTIINFIFTGIVDASEVEFLSCFESASKEKVASLKAKEEAQEEAERKAQEKEDEVLLRENYENDQKKKAKQKELFEAEMKNREERNNNTNISGTLGVDGTNYKNKLAAMSTPTINELQSAASKAGVSNEYLKIVIGTTQNEGYINDPYLNYGWASAMINNPVSISQMQGWDPGRSGEANFYSQTNINNGYNNASSDVLKSVYLALTERNTKIIECNGMYSTTPSSYNLLYESPIYNCSIYEMK